jgi:uncharacterized membrane protein
MGNVPFYVPAVFILTTLLTAFIFYKASNRSRTVLLIVGIWLLLQGIIGYTGFYLIEDTTPPRFVLLVGPTLLAIIFLFISFSGRRFLSGLNDKWLTWLHIVRIPVEIVLYWLFIYKLVPEDMTFEGQNLDIFSGLTAPFIAYFGYHKKMLNKWILVAWNLVCLALLFNIVSMAILSAPSPFQSRAFDQPNVGVLYFPFVWLPGFIVPVVLLSHLTLLKKLLFMK